MDMLLSQVEWLLLLFVLLSAVLSVLQIASLLSFYGVLVMFMEPEAVVPIATLFFLSMNLTKMSLFRSEVNWQLTRTLVLASVPGVVLGAFLLAYLPTDFVRRVVCAFVILFLLVEIFKLKTYEIRSTRLALLGVGMGYGFLSGLIGSGSIVRTPLLLKMKLSKGAFIGTAAAASLFSNVIKVGAYWSTGLMTSYVLVNGALSVVVGVVGGRLGKLLLGHVSDQAFTGIVRYALLASAVIGLLT
jgi:uncharacterized membrane protein YfcA